MSFKKSTHVTDSAKIPLDHHTISFFSREETTVINLVGVVLGLLGLFLCISYIQIYSYRNTVWYVVSFFKNPTT